MDDELFIICSKNHLWAARKKIGPGAISEQNIIIREQGSGTREVFENTMSKHIIPYSIKHVLNNTEAIKKAEEANIGISVVSEIAIKEEIKSGRLVKINLAYVLKKVQHNLPQGQISFKTLRGIFEASMFW
ncbi:MAG: LysR substrate-binding domain-containing protein [Tepidanaerobacteraceae bacterium]|jgi:DNA-binding transcriptional LysR family regulator|nr:LysR substrate-binding domain-containing protein [Tepidanaerobacteraceae bacterium]